MNDMISVQLAISKLHLKSLVDQQPTDPIAVQAIAELNTTLAELEAINAELLEQNNALAAVTASCETDRRRYQELFEHVPVAYLITDGWGVIEEANAAAEKLLNVRRDMLRGKPISVFVPPSERRSFRDAVNGVAQHAGWQSVFHTRDRDRIHVQLDISEIPQAAGGERKLGWVIQNLSPQLAAASAEKMLARETHLRLEAQAAVLRLRALNVGLETMAHDVELPVRQRVLSLLEALVPRFANQMSCYLPRDSDGEPVAVGASTPEDQTLQTVILGPNSTEGRLIARRNGSFAAEDGAILQSAANGVSLLLYAANVQRFVHAR